MGRDPRTFASGAGSQGQAVLPCGLQDRAPPAGRVEPRDVRGLAGVPGPASRAFRQDASKARRAGGSSAKRVRVELEPVRRTCGSLRAGFHRGSAVAARAAGTEEEQISLGRAAEILGLTRDGMKKQAREWAGQGSMVTGPTVLLVDADSAIAVTIARASRVACAKRASIRARRRLSWCARKARTRWRSMPNSSPIGREYIRDLQAPRAERPSIWANRVRSRLLTNAHAGAPASAHDAGDG